MDATVPMMMGESKEAALRQLQEAILTANPDQVRPLAFLFGSAQGTSFATFEEILTLLSAVPGKPR